MPQDNTPMAPILPENIVYDLTADDDINYQSEVVVRTSNMNQQTSTNDNNDDDVIMTAPSSPDKNWKNFNNENNAGGIGGGGSMMMLNNGPGPSTSRNQSSSSSFSSGINKTPLNNNLIIIVHYKTNMYKIELHSSSTIGDLKEKICNVTLILPRNQELSGWQTRTIEREAQNDTAILRNLVLSTETTLILRNSLDDSCMDDEGNASDSNNTEYTLHIFLHALKSNKTLKFRGNQTLLDVKNGVYSVTDIAVRHQNWNGWPINFTNNMTLSVSNLTLYSSILHF